MKHEGLELQLAPSSMTPLYKQIADQIRQRVISGELEPGDALPPVRTLAEGLGCNPSTVARAYAELTREGMIAGQRGAGTRVIKRELPASETMRRAHLANIIERPLLEALRAGYAPVEIEAAFSLALSRWQALHPSPDSPGSATAQASALRFVGSHDPVVELLATQLRKRGSGIDLSMTFAGSLKGLMALARREADIAGAHLRDEQTGDYNVDYVRHILPGRQVTLVTLVTRPVGLIVASGNPKAIKGIQDLARPDVTLINRQAGSGTRLMLDRRLRELRIMPCEVAGYDREVTTHLDVATAIARGDADVGIGVKAAAQAWHLDFILLLHERYDLVIPDEVWESAAVRVMLDIIWSDEFHTAVQALGGYDISEMGCQIRL